jgi:hypothetical protein
MKHIFLADVDRRSWQLPGILRGRVFAE